MIYPHILDFMKNRYNPENQAIFRLKHEGVKI
jgi:hypothetical protein